jgi:hypothetical protein
MKHVLSVLVVLCVVASRADALIEFSLGNDPVNDADWPAGSVAMANLKTRGGWWNGPPLGGGHSTFEYQGDARAMQEAIDVFAKIKWPELRLIIHGGAHDRSFIFPKEKHKDRPGPDWSFAVWHPGSFYDIGSRTSRRAAARAIAADRAGRTIEPPTMEVYLSGRIDWNQIKLPGNLNVIDERATANGYAPADGSVVRGQAYDMVDSKPVADAEFRLSTYVGQAWTPKFTARTDADGRFEIKNIPPGHYSVTVVSADHASRTVGDAAILGDTLKEYVVMLAPPARVAGVVKDESGKPIAGAKVSSESTVAVDGAGYTLDKRLEATTDENGRFEMTGLPAGTVTFSVHAPGSPRVDGTGKYTAPSENIELRAVTKAP